MPIFRPDIYQHNNPNFPISDSNFVRGGVRSAVASLNELYEIGSGINDKVNQLKEYATQVYVSGEGKFYILKDITNRTNADGWISSSINDNVVYQTGNQTISGLKTFITRPQVNGTGLLLSGEAATNINLVSTGFTLNNKINNLSGYINSTGSNIVFTTGEQTINGFKTFNNDVSISGDLKLNTVNGNTSFGVYKYNITGSSQKQYIQKEAELNDNLPVTGIRNGDIVNLYFGDVNNGISNGYSKTLKIDPGILVDHEDAPSSRNLIKFSDDGMYSGKAVRKVRYNSTVGNGYVRFLLTPDSFSANNCPSIRPKTRRLETFYDINVPSGGGGATRFILFRTPTSFPFVQGLCMNLRFNFEADSTPCIISGVTEYNEHVFTLSGANYSFIQKERVILISKGDNGTTSEFKLW